MALYRLEGIMPKLTDTQSLILSRAAARARTCAMPLPAGLAGAAAKTVVLQMIERGWLEEDAATQGKGQDEAPWRLTYDGRGITLRATAAGLEAVGIDPLVGHCVTQARRHRLSKDITAATPRGGSKQALLIDMLQRPEGASLAEIVTATGWLAHTARSVISSALKKRLCLPVRSCKEEGRGTVYRLPLV